MAELNFNVNINTKSSESDVEKLQEKIRQLNDKLKGVTETSEKMKSSLNFSNLTVGLNAGISLAGQFLDVLSTPIKSAAQFESYEASLKVMLGSTEAAKTRLAELVEFAKVTPFELPQVVTAANQLQAIGKYSKENMTMLGDLASAAGKPYEQVLSAYAKLATGQKGVAVDMFRDLLISQKDWVEATGKGTKSTGELLATTEEMMAALPKILNAKNFTGMMDVQSQTFSGQLSNFQDAIGQMMTAIGNAVLPIAKDVLSALTPIFSFVKDNLSSIGTFLGIAAAGWVAYTVVMNASAVATNIVAVATKALNAIMSMSPIGLFITGLTLAVGAAVALADALTTTAEEELEMANSQVEVIKTQEGVIESQVKGKQSTLDLMEEYKNIAEKEKLSIEDKKRLSEITIKLNGVYPGLISSNDSYAQALVKMGLKAGDTTREMIKLNGELTNLQIQEQKMMGVKLTAQIRVDKVKAWEEIKGSFGFFDKAKGQLVANVSTGQFEAEVLAAKSFDDLQKAKVNFSKFLSENMAITTDNDMATAYTNAMNFAEKMTQGKLELMKSQGVEDPSVKKAREDAEKKTKEEEEKAKRKSTSGAPNSQKTKAEKEEKKKSALENYKAELEFWDMKSKAGFVGFAQYETGVNEILGKMQNKNVEFLTLQKKQQEGTITNDEWKLLTDYMELANKYSENIYKVFAKGFEERFQIINKSGEDLRSAFDNNKISQEEYYNSLKNLELDLTKAVGEQLLNRYNNNEKLTKEELKVVKSYLREREEIQKSLKGIEGTNIKSSITKQEIKVEEAKIQFDKTGNRDDYYNALKGQQTQIETLLKDYPKILEKMKTGELTKAFLDDQIEAMKKSNPVLADNLQTMVTSYENSQKELDKLGGKGMFSGVIEGIVSGTGGMKNAFTQISKIISDKIFEQKKNVESFSDFMKTAGALLMANAASAIGTAFQDGFEWSKLGTGLKEAFKSTLIQLINMIEVKMVIAKLAAALENILFPVPGANPVAWTKIAMLAGLAVAAEAAKGMISALAVGSYVTKPTMALIGEAGPEFVAPEKDFRYYSERLIQEERNRARYYNDRSNTQDININVTGSLSGKGRDLYGIIQTEKIQAGRRVLYGSV